MVGWQAPRSVAERLQSERGVKSLFGGNKGAGGRSKAKPYSLPSLQRGGRAAHFRAETAPSESSKKKANLPDCRQGGLPRGRGPVREGQQRSSACSDT